MSARPTLYKFTGADGSAPLGSGIWHPKRWRTVAGALVPCLNGLHGVPVDNLAAFVNEALWVLEVDESADWLWHDDSSGRKLVARRARLIERVDAWNEQTARMWAADCAEHVLSHFEDRFPDDPRPRQAIEVARRFAGGEATEDERSEAWSAAWDVVGAAAAGAAAWAARAGAWAAGAAVRAGADSAADSAAGAAAGAAAWAAADSAAGAAAGAAAWAARAAAWAAGAAVRAAAWAAADSAAGAAAWAAVRAAADSAADSAGAAERDWQSRRLATILGLPWDAPIGDEDDSARAIRP